MEFYKDMKMKSAVFLFTAVWIATSMLIGCTGAPVSTSYQTIPVGERPLDDNFEDIKRIREEVKQKTALNAFPIRLAVGPIIVKADSDNDGNGGTNISINVSQSVFADSDDEKDDGYKSKYRVNEVARSRVIMDLSNDARVEVRIPETGTQKAIMKGRYDTQDLSDQDIDYLVDGTISTQDSGGVEKHTIYLRIWDTDMAAAAAAAEGKGETIDQAAKAAVENLLKNYRRKSNNAG